MSDLQNVLWWPWRGVLLALGTLTFKVLMAAAPGLSERFLLLWLRLSSKYPRWLGEPRPKAVAHLGDGVLVDCDLRDVVQRALYYRGAWEPEITRTLPYLLREGDVFIDIGAHVGYYALKAWRLVGRRGLIIAFEPSLAQFGSLSANLLRNRCETILAVSCALGDSLGQGFLYQASHENVGATSIRPQAGCPRFAVLIARLDDVLPQDLWSRVRLIKIDVEGWESSVLKGMRKLLATAPVPAIIMEIREKFLRQTGTSAAEVVGYLQGLGYRGRAVTSEGRGQNAFAPLPDFPGEDVSADVLFLRGSEGERIALDLGMDLSLGEEGAGSA